jgi:hypothetical protein
MLMRVQQTNVDYNHVKPEHEAVHERLSNWARWVRVRPQGWQTQPMFRNFRASKQWEASPHIPTSVDSLDGLLIERVVSSLPDKHKAVLRWLYVFPSLHCNAMQRSLAVTADGLQRLIQDARSMANNLSRK